MLDAFEARSGAKVTAVFMDQGLVNRLESRPLEADIVITKDAELLEIAANKACSSPSSPRRSSRASRPSSATRRTATSSTPTGPG